MQKGHLFVVSGPSGAGKSKICRELVKDGEAKLSISMTTRAIRPKEIENVSYYFVSDEEFDKTIKEDGFLEYAGVYSHRYGTPKKPVLEALESGQDVILEIEMQGAMQVKKNYPDAILIFILPPNLQALRDRLDHRHSENEQQLMERTQATLAEIHRIKDYDYFVINDVLQDAISLTKSIIRATHGDEQSIEFTKDNIVNEAAIEMTKKYDEEAK